MTYRWINVGFLVLILAIGAIYLWLARDLALHRLRDDLRPIMFPVALGGGVVILSMVEIFRTLRSADSAQSEPFRIKGAGRLVATVALVTLYYIAWQKLGQFYPATALLMMALILTYRGRGTMREVLAAVGIALAFTLALYLIFDLAFGINFTH